MHRRFICNEHPRWNIKDGSYIEICPYFLLKFESETLHTMVKPLLGTPRPGLLCNQLSRPDAACLRR
jgi:hypothetical protein